MNEAARFCNARANNPSLQVSRDCVFFMKSLFFQVVATRAAT